MIDHELAILRPRPGDVLVCYSDPKVGLPVELATAVRTAASASGALPVFMWRGEELDSALTVLNDGDARLLLRALRRRFPNER